MDPIRVQLQNVLSGPITARIQFGLAGVMVNRSLFRDVSTAVAGNSTPNGRLFPIRVVVNPGLRSNRAFRNALTGVVISPGIDAQYDGTTNSFIFSNPCLATLDARALAVHESVHAGFDLHRVKITAIDDEAAAYIAQCLYLIYAGHTFGTGMTPTFTAAAAAAATVARGLQITSGQIADLRAALWNDPNYTEIRKKTYQYTHDG
ncbi:MAG TPA: hypothetical protein VKU01_25685 [Bryobacteraceae bacterium]|nr:hypothetical protein [Bryobacteraceae bacterium]